MSCLDCLIKFFQIDTHTISKLEEIVIIKNNNIREITPINILEEEEEIIYEKECPKNEQILTKRIIKKEIDYSSADSWDNSLIK